MSEDVVCSSAHFTYFFFIFFKFNKQQHINNINNIKSLPVLISYYAKVNIDWLVQFAKKSSSALDIRKLQEFISFIDNMYSNSSSSTKNKSNDTMLDLIQKDMS